MSDRFKPNTTVAAIIVWQDQFLFVEEYDQEKLVLNQPAGHIEAFESIENAAKREVIEETGLDVEFDYLQGSYYFYSEQIKTHYLRFCYVVDLTSVYQLRPQSSPNDPKITGLRWIPKSDIRAYEAQFRSPLVKLCLDDYFSNKRMPDTAIVTNL